VQIGHSSVWEKRAVQGRARAACEGLSAESNLEGVHVLSGRDMAGWTRLPEPSGRGALNGIAPSKALPNTPSGTGALN